MSDYNIEQLEVLHQEKPDQRTTYTALAALLMRLRKVQISLESPKDSPLPIPHRTLDANKSSNSATPKQDELDATTSAMKFVKMKVETLTPEQQAEFLDAKQGKQPPKFVDEWREELDYEVSDKTWSNALSENRKKLREIPSKNLQK